MQSNITFKRSRRVVKTLAALMLLCFTFGSSIAQPYVNGNLTTGATATGGTAAPAGYTWSEVQAGNTSGGFAASITATGFKVADDFTVPAGQTWNLSTMVFYGYQTGYASTTVSPFTTVRVTIHSGSVTGPVVFGDQTTNRFASSANANMYRIFNATPDQTRRIWSITATTAATLTAGTYWVEYATDVTGGAGHFLPASTVVGTVTQPGNNAQQWTGTAWVPLVDGTNAQDMPFTVNYTATGAACTAVSPGNTISSAAAVCPAVPFTLSVQTPGTGIGLSYQWQSSANNTTYTDIAGATSATLTTTQTAATWYRLRVTCGANAPLLSTPVNVTMSTACYCIPAASDCTDGDIITNVTLGTLNNTSACGTNGYTNYTTNSSITVPDLIQGGNIPISVTAGDGGFTENVGVWIDYNQNGTFETSEFSTVGLNAATPTVRTGTIPVPATALLGNTRMRVRVRFSTQQTGTMACTTYAFGETEDYTVKIVPCTPVAITGSPASAAISCGGNTSFTVTATGSLPSYQWEFRTSSTAAWQLITATTSSVYSGINTNALQLTSAPVSFNGYQYRAIVSGACTGPDFSSAATLTVSAFTLAVTPTSGSVCSTGATPVLLTVPNNTAVTPFINNTTGTIPDNSTTGITRGITVSGVTGTILNATLKLNIAHTWVGDLAIALKAPNGQVMSMDYYLTGTGGTAATTGFTNTILNSANTTPLLNSGSNPWSSTFAADGTLAATVGLTDAGPAGFTPTTSSWAAMFAGGVNGTWTIGIIDGGAGDIGTFTDATLSFTAGSAPATAVFTPVTGLYTNAAATTPYTGTAVSQVYAMPTATTTYSAVVSTATCSTAPQSIVITVNTPVTGTPAVANQSTCAGTNATFAVTGITGGTGATYQWQVSTAVAPTFTDIAGATSATYTVTAPTVAQNGNQYRVKITSAGCAASTTLTSTAGTLTVNATPVVVISAAPSTSVVPGSTVTLTAAVSPNAAASYQWYNNGVAVAGATSNTLVVGVDGVGSYTVKVTDVNGCSNTANASTPASITITPAQTAQLFIYPSPNTGKFQVRYFNDLNDGQNGPAILNVYDSRGSRVYTNRYVLAPGYQAMWVDLASHGKGVYRVELMNTNGERLKTGNVLVY